MEISAKITGIEYKIRFTKELERFNFEKFDINKLPASCLIENNNKLFALSKWVSPKRTRSYPYERVYNTLSFPKKITVIPVVKDEGCGGDRDFIQWDTISLMSLLDVYVILAYYDSAEKHKTRPDKITNQKFNNEYIVNKIKEIENYHSSALHWNIKEINDNLSLIIDKVKENYLVIENALNIKLHSKEGLDNFKAKLKNSVHEFMDFSRKKAQEAQAREVITTQPKELLQTLTKTKITLTNYLGGKYYLTVDEVDIVDNDILLIESKHSKKGILPSINDIKDGLIKMILFVNLKEGKIDKKNVSLKPILQLTSNKIHGSISSNLNENEINSFLRSNKIPSKHQKILQLLLIEATENNFEVNLKGIKNQ